MLKLVDQLQFIPPYCPNNKCKFHFGTKETFFVKNGWVKTYKPPFRNQRFRCKMCLEQFSENTFSLDFRKRITLLSERVLNFTMNGMSNNSAARLLKVNEGTVRNRLITMARQGLIFEKQNLPKNVEENVAYDGFETFTNSQFSPCYINTAVGSHSHFIYHNTISPLNRKGRMTEHQKQINNDLRNKYGPYPRDSIYEETTYIMKSLSEKAPGIKFWTDEHRTYLRAFRSFDCQLTHMTISSEERRDSNNPLFPINRLHNLYRHFFSSQHRETISFQKHEAALLEKVQLMKIYNNFMKPKFVKKNKFDPHAHDWSPAMYIGVAQKILEFNDVFGLRKLPTQVKMDSREKNFIERNYPFSRQKITA